MAVLPAENVGGCRVTADEMETSAGSWPGLCVQFLVLKLEEEDSDVTGQ